MSLPLYGIVAIAAGGGTLVLAALISFAIAVHRRRRHRSSSVLENLRLSLRTGSNVRMQEVRAYSPTKRSSSWRKSASRRNKLQRSPQHARTLREASSRDSIKPLIRHKRSRDGARTLSVSIVDTSELEIVEPASVYVPTGRPDNVPLIPIPERDTPPPNEKTYRGVSRMNYGFGGTFGGQPRPLPIPKSHQRRSLSESATAANMPTLPRMPKSILKKGTFLRSVSLQNQPPGPVPELELPPTPKLAHAVLPPARQNHGTRREYVQNLSRNCAPYGGQVVANDAPLSFSDMYATPTTQLTFLRTLGRNVTPPEYQQHEISNLRNMDNSPAHSTKYSIRPAFRSHNSYQADVELSSLVREKSSSLSLSLQDNWLTPSKPVVGSEGPKMTKSTSSISGHLVVADHTGRQVLTESSGNSNRQSVSSGSSQSLWTGRYRKLAVHDDRRTAMDPPRSESDECSWTQRVVLQPSRPNSMATSAMISRDLEYDFALHQNDPQSEIKFTPTFSPLPPSLRPPSVAEFNPAIEGVPGLHGLQRALEDDPEFQNPNPEYSPLMSICRDMLDDNSEYTISPLEPRKRLTMTLPPPTRDTPLTSSPPGSPLKADEELFPKPTKLTPGLPPLISANISSLRKHPKSHRGQNRSPLRQAHRPSDSPEPPGRAVSRESLAKQQSRMTTAIMALRRQNSDVSQHDVPYFRLSTQTSSARMIVLNSGLDHDPFTDTRPAYLPGHEPTDRGRIQEVEASRLEVVREKLETELGLSPTTKRMMAEERIVQNEGRRSKEKMGLGDFGAIGEERKRKQNDEQEKKMSAKTQTWTNLAGAGAGRLSPGQILTEAGAF